MIVSPDKGVFFVATALMCSASLYGAELVSSTSDPLERVFVGVPNQLSLPPGFPENPASLQAQGCAPPVAEAPFPQELRTAAAAVNTDKDCSVVPRKEEPAVAGSPAATLAPARTPAKAAAASSASASIIAP